MVGRISGIIIEMRERYRIPILENELETCKKQTQNAGRILEVFRQVSNLIDVREDANHAVEMVTIKMKPFVIFAVLLIVLKIVFW